MREQLSLASESLLHAAIELLPANAGDVLNMARVLYGLVVAYSDTLFYFGDGHHLRICRPLSAPAAPEAFSRLLSYLDFFAVGGFHASEFLAHCAVEFDDGVMFGAPSVHHVFQSVRFPANLAEHSFWYDNEAVLCMAVDFPEGLRVVDLNVD